MIDNKKNILAIATSIFSVAAVGILYFAPIDKLNVPGNYQDYKEHVSELNSANELSKTSFKAMNDLKVQVTEKESELSTVKAGSEKSTELFDKLLSEQEKSGSWSYHIPSLLIKLESFGDSTGTKVAIDYSSLKSEGTYVSESQKGLKYVDVNVEVYGDYDSVNSYMKKVEKIDFVSIQNLKLNLVKDGDLAGSFSMKVYYME